MKAIATRQDGIEEGPGNNHVVNVNGNDIKENGDGDESPNLEELNGGEDEKKIK